MKKGRLAISASLLFLAFQTVCLAGPTVTFDMRVKAQKAIEGVYYQHRIWPKENPQPKPPFEQIMPETLIQAKVTDYLLRSAAIEEFWRRPITARQLQEEMGRMARQTKDPAMLKELFAALGNDPVIIAECLARPTLAERLIRGFYGDDRRIHQETRAKAESALVFADGGSLAVCKTGHFRMTTFVLQKQEDQANHPRGKREPWTVALDSPGFQKECQQCPEAGKPAVLRDTPEAVVLIRTLRKTDTQLEIESLSFPKQDLSDWLKCLNIMPVTGMAASLGQNYFLPEISPRFIGDSWSNGILDDPLDARSQHAAIWTGTEMIIWGGSPALDTGGRYDPSTDTWTLTSKGANLPSGRRAHSAVWTGTAMIIWGGRGDSDYLNTGARYSPSSDAWTPTSMGTSCPESRAEHTAIWTGTEMIIWGGYASSGHVNTGGKYDPASGNWTATSTAIGCPSARTGHTVVWTDAEMIVWGGEISSSPWQTNTGGKYDPLNDTWTATSTGLNCPSIRYVHTAVWTGTEMIVWGGYSSSFLNDGARYVPSVDSWTPTSTGLNCPVERDRHSAVWTGEVMIVWGGWSSAGTLNDGGQYTPSGDTWTPTSTEIGCPSTRYGHTAVWTATEMIVWGGLDNSFNPMNTGGRYDPSGNAWMPTQDWEGVPEARSQHASVWTGSEMVVWGGYNNTSSFNSGGKYSPSLDSWTGTSMGTGCPTQRYGSTAVWTGTEMIVWGGYGYDSGTGEYDALNTGGRYSPSGDTWMATSTGINVPVAREYHTAVWTSAGMIVWGGEYYDSDAEATYYYNSGAVYIPLMDAWVPTSTGGDCPVGRSNHTAVRTGTEMIVWGGVRWNVLPQHRRKV